MKKFLLYLLCLVLIAACIPSTSIAQNVGELSPDVSLPNEKGEYVALSSLKDNFIYVNFWASWCPTCAIQLPHLTGVYNKYHRKVFRDANGFAVYNISLDGDRYEWLSASKRFPSEWVNCCDFKGYSSPAVRKFGVNRIPSNYLLNPNGIIIGKDLTFAELDQRLHSSVLPDNLYYRIELGEFTSLDYHDFGPISQLGELNIEQSMAGTHLPMLGIYYKDEEANEALHYARERGYHDARLVLYKNDMRVDNNLAFFGVSETYPVYGSDQFSNEAVTHQHTPSGYFQQEAPPISYDNHTINPYQPSYGYQGSLFADNTGYTADYSTGYTTGYTGNSEDVYEEDGYYDDPHGQTLTTSAPPTYDNYYPETNTQQHYSTDNTPNYGISDAYQSSNTQPSNHANYNNNTTYYSSTHQQATPNQLDYGISQNTYISTTPQTEIRQSQLPFPEQSGYHTNTTTGVPSYGVSTQTYTQPVNPYQNNTYPSNSTYHSSSSTPQNIGISTETYTQAAPIHNNSTYSNYSNNTTATPPVNPYQYPNTHQNNTNTTSNTQYAPPPPPPTQYNGNRLNQLKSNTIPSTAPPKYTPSPTIATTPKYNPPPSTSSNVYVGPPASSAIPNDVETEQPTTTTPTYTREYTPSQKPIEYKSPFRQPTNTNTPNPNTVTEHYPGDGHDHSDHDHSDHDHSGHDHAPKKAESSTSKTITHSTTPRSTYPATYPGASSPTTTKAAASSSHKTPAVTTQTTGQHNTPRNTYPATYPSASTKKASTTNSVYDDASKPSYSNPYDKPYSPNADYGTPPGDIQFQESDLNKTYDDETQPYIATDEKPPHNPNDYYNEAEEEMSSKEIRKLRRQQKKLMKRASKLHKKMENLNKQNKIINEQIEFNKIWD